MRLREAYIETESSLLEKRTEEAIRKIQISPGIQSPEYEEKYEAIMQEYRLRVEAIRILKL